MRYDQPVTLIKELEECYDPTQDSSDATRGKAYAAKVVQMGAKRQMLVYGAVRNEAITVYIQAVIDERYHRVIVDDVSYSITGQRQLRGKHVVEAVRR